MGIGKSNLDFLINCYLEKTKSNLKNIEKRII